MENVRENATPSRTLLILKTHTHTHTFIKTERGSHYTYFTTDQLGLDRNSVVISISRVIQEKRRKLSQNKRRVKYLFLNSLGLRQSQLKDVLQNS
jgi:hypothetical protein